MPYGLAALTERVAGDPYVVFLVVEYVAILISLLVLHWYLRTWFDVGASLGGVLGLAAFVPLTFTNTWAHPDTFPDLALFTLGCLAIARRHDIGFASVLAVGMFNRETMGFLVLLWGALRLPERKREDWVRFAGYLAIAGTIFVGLRWARGLEHYRMFMLGENLRMLEILPAGFDPFTRVFGYFWLVLLAVPGWLAVSGCRAAGAPPFFRAAVAVSLVYLSVVWVFAAIAETRVLLPILALLLPAALSNFAPVTSSRVPGAGPPGNPTR
jgi:hypothetical protein